MKWVVTLFFLCVSMFESSKTAACICLLLALRSTHGVAEWQNLPLLFQYLKVICTFLDGAVKETRATCEVGKFQSVAECHHCVAVILVAVAFVNVFLSQEAFISRHAARQYQSYDAFARVSMAFGTHQLMQSPGTKLVFCLVIDRVLAVKLALLSTEAPKTGKLLASDLRICYYCLGYVALQDIQDSTQNCGGKDISQ